MARGKNSPVIGDNGIVASAADLSVLANFTQAAFLSDMPDLHNPKEVEKAILNYFVLCEQRGLRVGNMGMYAALGMTRQDVNDMLRGANKSKVSPECVDIIRKGLNAISLYREQLALTGKLNPVTYIFMAKNYDGMTDTQQIEITANNGPAANMTPEQIAAQIDKDIPIDTEYTIDNSQ